MITTNYLDETAKKTLEILLDPIEKLTSYFKEKLNGSYQDCEIRGIKDLYDCHRITLNHEFPGCCYIDSKDYERKIIVKIRFNWAKWDSSMPKAPKQYFDCNIIDEKNKPNYFCNLAIEHLETPEFIEAVRNFLDGKENLKEIPWEKWEIENE